MRKYRRPRWCFGPLIVVQTKQLHWEIYLKHNGKKLRMTTLYRRNIDTPLLAAKRFMERYNFWEPEKEQVLAAIILHEANEL